MAALALGFGIVGTSPAAAQTSHSVVGQIRVNQVTFTGTKGAEGSTLSWKSTVTLASTPGSVTDVNANSRLDAGTDWFDQSIQKFSGYTITSGSADYPIYNIGNLYFVPLGVAAAGHTVIPGTGTSNLYQSSAVNVYPLPTVADTTNPFISSIGFRNASGSIAEGGTFTEGTDSQVIIRLQASTDMAATTPAVLDNFPVLVELTTVNNLIPAAPEGATTVTVTFTNHHAIATRSLPLGDGIHNGGGSVAARILSGTGYRLGSGTSTATDVTLTVQAGNNIAHRDFPVTDDNTKNPDGSVRVRVVSSVDYIVVAGDASVNLIDDDPLLPTVTLSADAALPLLSGIPTVTEGADVVMRISLSRAHTAPLTVPVTIDEVGNFVDFQGRQTRNVVIPQGETGWRFTVDIIDDNTDEPDESLTIAIDTANVPASHAGVAGSSIISLLDDEAEPVLQAADGGGAKGGGHGNAALRYNLELNYGLPVLQGREVVILYARRDLRGQTGGYALGAKFNYRF